MKVLNPFDQWFVDLAQKLNGWGILLYVLISLLLSGLIASLFGLQRYRDGENAGIRTHALLTIGCSFLMTISVWAIHLSTGAEESYDVSRIAAGAIAGVGFMGAGVIIKDKFTVKGLSTVSTLWVCAAIGLAVGCGFILEAIIAALIIMLTIIIRNLIIKKVDKNAPHLTITCKKGYPICEKVIDLCSRNSIHLKNVDISAVEDDSVTAKAYFPYKMNKLLLEYLIIELQKDEEILKARVVDKNK